MKIAYGVHGYGRGHSSRALAVLPELNRRHEVLVLAGGDAHAALHDDYNVVRIPTLRYYLQKSGKRSTWRTVLHAIPNMLDLRLRGPGLQNVCEILQDFGPDVVVSDSETLTHWAAHLLKIPRISFDHFAVLVYCDWPMTWTQRIICRLEAVIYQRFMGRRSDRYVIASFYPAEPKREGVCVVGPVLRDVVHQASPSQGDFLLVYLSNGHIHFTPRLERALKLLDVPVVVYGVGREGPDGNIDFRPPSNTRFVEDLAACRAVFSTAGNQLISEALHFRKPLLVMPEDSLEQRLNAIAVEDMGIGMATSRRRICIDQLRAFLAGHSRFVDHFPAETPDGRQQALAAIERFAKELQK